MVKSVYLLLHLYMSKKRERNWAVKLRDYAWLMNVKIMLITKLMREKRLCYKGLIIFTVRYQSTCCWINAACLQFYCLGFGFHWTSTHSCLKRGLIKCSLESGGKKNLIVFFSFGNPFSHLFFCLRANIYRVLSGLWSLHHHSSVIFF